MKNTLLSLTNKEFSYSCISILIEKQRPADIIKLTDPIFCKQKFHMKYAILKEVPLIENIPKETFLDHTLKRRYYPEPIVAYGKNYILCNDWYYKGKSKRDTRTNFVNWVLA